MFNLLSQSLRDYFSFRILSLAFVPALISMVVCGFIFYYNADNAIAWAFQMLPNWLTNINGTLGNILSVSLSVLVYGFLVVLAVVIALITNVFVSIFYTPLIVSYLHKHYYSQIHREEFGGIWDCVLEFGKLFLFFGVAFIVCIPLYFVPIIGHIVLILSLIHI